MARNIIYAPTIELNNTILKVVGNSVNLMPGRGSSNLNAQSVGNGAVEMVYSENVEEKVAQFKCAVFTTAENIDKILEAKDNHANNVVTINSADKNIVILDVALVNDPELSFGNDGQANLEFKGRPIQ